MKGHARAGHGEQSRGIDLAASQTYFGLGVPHTNPCPGSDTQRPTPCPFTERPLGGVLAKSQNKALGNRGGGMPSTRKHPFVRPKRWDSALWLCGTGKETNAMNRHERRKAKVLSRLGHKNHGPTVVAVHEAGHAVAKVLAIGELGYSIDEAIEYIDMGSNKALGPSVDGQMMMHSQGVTFGHTLCKQIEEASPEFKEAYLSEHGHGVLQGAEAHEFLCKTVELGRAAGADIGKMVSCPGL